MKKDKDDEMLDDYGDLLKDGVRGKYYERFGHGARAVVLEPDVAKEFPTARSVNEALRTYLKGAKQA